MRDFSADDRLARAQDARDAATRREEQDARWVPAEVPAEVPVAFVPLHYVRPFRIDDLEAR